jgi:hypothetical protein
MISQNRHTWRSFAGGELSEEMYGRTDLPRHAIGLTRCYNAIVTPQGALKNRAGSRYIANINSGDPAYLIPFVNTDGQGYLIEIGYVSDTTTYAALYLNGNQVLYTAPANVIDVTGVVSYGARDEHVLFTSVGHGLNVGDDVTLAGFSAYGGDNSIIANDMGRTLYVHTVPTADTFTLRYTAGAPTIDNERVSWYKVSTYPGTITPGTVQNLADSTHVVISPLPYAIGQVPMIRYAQHTDDLVLTHQAHPVGKITRTSDTVWAYSAVTFNAALAAPGAIAVTAFGVAGADPITYQYTVTATDEAGTESAIGTPDSDTNTLRTLGNFNETTWNSVATTFRYNIYKSIGGATYGYIGSSTGLGFVDDNISPDYTKQPPVIIADFNAAGEYPGSVAFYEERMILAGSSDEPQAFWVSGLAAFDYFKASVPPQDDQAFTYSLSSLRAAPILHTIAQPELMFFTSAGVQRILSTDQLSFNPLSVAARGVSSYGAHPVARPQEAGTTVLYPIARGNHLYQLKAANTDTGYESADMSIIAAHLIDDYDWLQTAIQQAPFPVWYGLRDDGIIIAFTYMPEQEVYAWWQIELPGGVIESLCVVPEGDTDSLYVAVRREIDGSTVRYIERIEQHTTFETLADSFFVDAGITYEGEATTTITGLDHLEGEEVIALADGRVVGPYTVNLGAIELDSAAEKVQVGLAYTTEIETLPLPYLQAQGQGLGIMKNLSALWLRVKNTLGITAGATFEDEDQVELPGLDASQILEDPVALSEAVSFDITPQWDLDGTVCIKQSQPLPMTITACALDYVDG